jgi:hypothetical protein
MIFLRQPVVIPQPGKLPKLPEGEHFAPIQVVSQAPAIDGFFRPEE